MRLLCVEHKTMWGGGQVALTNLLREWQRTNASIRPIIVCPPDAELAARSRALGLETIIMPLGAIEKNESALWNVGQRIMPTVRLLDTLRRSRTELVLANGAFSFLASVFAAKLARVPIVWWEHNTTLPNDGMVRRMIGWANHIVVVSDAIRQQFLALVPDAEKKISVIYNGVDEGKFKRQRTADGGRRDAQIVGTVGRLSPEKGMGYFVDAANQLPSAFPNAQFLVVGDGPERAPLQARANPNAIRFLGQREDIPELLNTMDVFVLPSLAEAFGIAAIEAMACELPVVATRVGGLREIVVENETGLLVPPRDADALGSAISNLLADPSKCRAFGERGRACVLEKFTLAHQAEQWQRVLETLL